MARHKHYDCIVAWAAGEEIQCRLGDENEWGDVKDPVWAERNQYRIKPKIVKREGWVALFNNERDFPSCCGIYETEELCREINGNTAKVVRIEWEEEA